MLGDPPLADVAGNFGEPDQGAVLVADGVDHDQRPETAAVLAHAPAFALVVALARRGGEHARRQTGRAILAGVEPGEMLSDHLGRAVALEVLGPGVPVDDDARRIEHVDGVVLDRLHQEAKAPFAVVKRVLRRSPLGIVADDPGKADGAAVGADRLHDVGRPELAAILADQPSFVFGAPGVARLGEHARGETVRSLLRREEAGEMPADDLGGPIAGGPFRPGVPRADRAIDVEKANGVIRDGVDQKFKSLPIGQPADGVGRLGFHGHAPCRHPV